MPREQAAPGSEAPIFTTIDLAAGNLHRRMNHATISQDLYSVEPETTSAHWNVHVTWGVIRTAQLRVRASGKQNISVERQGIHHMLGRQMLRRCDMVPVRTLIESPANVRDCIPARIRERFYIAANQLCVHALPFDGAHIPVADR